MLFTVSLALKLAVQGVTAFSLHPGVIFTNLMRHISDNVLQAKGISNDLSILSIALTPC
jgi:NAD(P)-dependent dehydrogenase (short-subunit alcohol dehydrogenase family)